MDTLEIYHGPNAGYVLELYERYRQDPASVDPETRAVFESSPPPAELLTSPAPESPPPASPDVPCMEVSKIVGAARLARMIREVGHLGATIDPLGNPPPGDPGLKLGTHGLTTRDLLSLPASVVGGPLAENAENALEAMSLLRVAYSSTIGYEDDHIQIAEERKWLRDSIESRRFFSDYSDENKKELLRRLTEVEVFERFLHQTFIGQKRFSIEGCDMLVPMLDLIINNAAEDGMGEVLIGMAHRGRLNVLAHVLGKPYEALLAAFQTAQAESAAESDKGTFGWTGDVKYHQGAGRTYHGVRDMPVTLASNPSHLEYVDPVVLGRTRAAQERRDRPGPPIQDKKAAGSILIHGDAAFPGQGVVAETLNLSGIPGYSVGGTIHIITNNQIGFTTSPREGRSTLYASDLAKGYEVPIVHVNADDPMACIAAARMAYAYCRQFHKDFLIDLVGYRRWGHNEGDEPTFTQPRMYQKIAAHPTVRDLWARSLEREKIVTPEESEGMVTAVQQRLQDARNAPAAPDTQKTPNTTATPPGLLKQTQTSLPEPQLREINEALFTPPANFNVNPKLQRLLERRKGGLDEPNSIDWGHAEALALAGILTDGTPIRMTGQDVERGTFSHRHLVLNDPKTGGEYALLHTLPTAQASFAIYNSPLSEMAVLGFEYGYTRHAPGTLVMWEAQFGDFANSAQVIIDQFIVAGFAKWRQTPTLVMLLPHGYEGQGPEHSSARLERFLQLCANDNIRVVNPTTPAQYFHLLRRQAALLELAPRPLIVMTPKSLLRNPRSASSLADLTNGTFQPVLLDGRSQENPRGVTRLVLCSGKVYVDLIGREEYATTEGLAVARLEELYPFPSQALSDVLESYPNLREVLWMQEEPRNMGAWSFVQPRITELLKGRWELQYIGRSESAAPAEGSLAQHQRRQNRILAAALSDVPQASPQRGEVGAGR